MPEAAVPSGSRGKGIEPTLQLDAVPKPRLRLQKLKALRIELEWWRAFPQMQMESKALANLVKHDLPPNRIGLEGARYRALDDEQDVVRAQAPARSPLRAQHQPVVSGDAARGADRRTAHLATRDAEGSEAKGREAVREGFALPRRVDAHEMITAPPNDLLRLPSGHVQGVGDIFRLMLANVDDQEFLVEIRRGILRYARFGAGGARPRIARAAPQ